MVTWDTDILYMVWNYSWYIGTLGILHVKIGSLDLCSKAKIIILLSPLSFSNNRTFFYIPSFALSMHYYMTQKAHIFESYGVSSKRYREYYVLFMYIGEN